MDTFHIAKRPKFEEQEIDQGRRYNTRRASAAAEQALEQTAALEKERPGALATWLVRFLFIILRLTFDELFFFTSCSLNSRTPEENVRSTNAACTESHFSYLLRKLTYFNYTTFSLIYLCPQNASFCEGSVIGGPYSLSLAAASMAPPPQVNGRL